MTRLSFLVESKSLLISGEEMAVELETRRMIVGVKSIKFRHTPSEELALILREFRSMCNDAIRVALIEKPKNRFNLQKLAYPRLKEYGLHSHYILSACEVAYSVYRNKARNSVPYVKSGFLKLDSETYTLSHLLFRIPTRPRTFTYIELTPSNYQLSFIDDPSLKRGSVIATEREVIFSFSKKTIQSEPLGQMGIDINERNATWSDTHGCTKALRELSEVVEIRERYREIKAKIARNTHKDRRVQRRLLTKYGRRQRDRTIQLLHKVSNEIIRHAKANSMSITMVKLTGIRKLYRRGNGQGANYRGRMNGWAFGETQRQVEYKAKWEGIAVRYVNPRGTSSNCPNCGSHVVALQDRRLYCPVCDRTWDRDVLASMNIMAASLVRAALPPECSNEAERNGDGPSLLNKRAEVSLAKEADRTETGM